MGHGQQAGAQSARAGLRSQVTKGLQIQARPRARAGWALKAELQYNIICLDDLGLNAAEWDQKCWLMLLSTKHIQF